MRKYLLPLAALLLLIPNTGHSQALIAMLFGKKLSTDRLEVGFMFGAQGSWIYGNASGVPKIGFAIGAYADVKLWDKTGWSLCNYLTFKSPKGGTHIPVGMTLATGLEPLPDGVTIKRSITYLEVAPLLHRKLSQSWTVGAGPVFAFRLTAKDTYSIRRRDDDGKPIGMLDYSYRVTSDIRPVDVALAADAEYRFMKGKGMRLGFRYAQGLIDPYRPSTGVSGLNADVRLSLGIPIGGRSKAVVTTK